MSNYLRYYYYKLALFPVISDGIIYELITTSKLSKIGPL